MRNPTWQVWMMLTKIVENLFKTAFEGMPDKICSKGQPTKTFPKCIV